jgi:hypothetical protein
MATKDAKARSLFELAFTAVICAVLGIAVTAGSLILLMLLMKID